MHIIEHKQRVPISLQICWDFFSTPSNLHLLTPPYLGFSERSNGKPMYEGQIIVHRLTPFLGWTVEWVTEITHVKPFLYFIDEQRIGPYKFWHHEHRFQEIPGGVEIIDSVHYKLPGSFLGKIINSIKVRRDLDAIFSYRQKRITEIFGSITR